MDDDPVLRRLGEDLARDDPRLAELLERVDSTPRRWGPPRLLAVLLLGSILLTVALLVPPTVALGLTAMLLAILSPLAVCWLCTVADRPAR
jgi:hypothetical protein